MKARTARPTQPNVFPIPLPPLRERREDIPTLVRHFVGKYAAKLGKRIETITPETLALLNPRRSEPSFRVPTHG